MKKLKSNSRPLTHSEGFGHIENYYLSGLRPRDYYKQHGISEWQFYSWRRRYLAIHPQAESSNLQTKKFHPVNIESPCVTGISGIEICYPNGVRLVIGAEHSIEIKKLSELIKLRV